MLHGTAARVEEIFSWGVCRVSYRIPQEEGGYKDMMKSLRIEEVYPEIDATVLENWSVALVARVGVLVC